jgi:hypothetical protein
VPKSRNSQAALSNFTANSIDSQNEITPKI